MKSYSALGVSWRPSIGGAAIGQLAIELGRTVEMPIMGPTTVQIGVARFRDGTHGVARDAAAPRRSLA
jgi:hypothetical protein